MLARERRKKHFSEEKKNEKRKRKNKRVSVRKKNTQEKEHITLKQIKNERNIHLHVS